MKTYYEILGVKTNASGEEINRAYNAKYFKIDTVKEAYKTLINPESRKKYDEQLEKDRPKTYYEILGIAKNATEEEIINKYQSLSESERDSIDVQDAFNTLTEPKERAKYNIQQGMISLKKEAKLRLTSDIAHLLREEPRNTYTNYARDIYIRKYFNRVKLLESQIELVKNEKNIGDLSYRIKLSKLMTQLERTKQEFIYWKKGKDNKGKGKDSTILSKALANSIDKIEENNEIISSADTKTVEKLKLKLYNGFWKSVKAFSSGSIKLSANAWSKVQDIKMSIGSLPVKNLFISDAEFNEKVENSISRRI